VSSADASSTTAQPQPTHHPVVAETAAQREADLQLRIADAITAFAGSMPFVNIHAAVFAIWMLFLERSPWPTLTFSFPWRPSSCRPS